MNSFVHPQALENRLRVLTALARESGLSKNALASATGLSLTDMSYHARYLEENELIEAAPDEAEKTSRPSKGRPGLRYRLRKASLEILILQVDLPMIRLSRSFGDGSSEHILEKKISVRTQADLLNSLRALVEESRDEGKESTRVWLYISFAGVSDRTVLSSVDGIEAWRPYHLGPHFSKQLGLPVRILSAVSTLALGYSAANKGKDVFVVSLKAKEKIFRYAEIRGGKIRFGERGSSGVLGHFKVRGFEEPCYCGARGCLEIFLSSEESFSKKLSALENAVEATRSEAGLSTRGERVISARGWELSLGKNSAEGEWRFLSPNEESDLTERGARLIALEEIYRDLLLNLHPAARQDAPRQKKRSAI